MTLNTHRRRRARRSIAGILSLIALGVLMAIAVVPATGAPGDELLPDLTAQPVGEVQAVNDPLTTYTDSSGTHLVLRFSSYIANLGPGPLEVTGVNPVNRVIQGANLHQVITHEGDGVTPGAKTEALLPGAQLRYEETDGHNHWHFQNAARYSLYNGTATAHGTQQVGFSSKVGFCFLDIGSGDPRYNPQVDHPNNFLYSGPVAPSPTPFNSSTNNCLAHLPSFPDPNDDVVPQRTKVDMGISTGWRDVYEQSLPFQYVDVSDVVPGYYWIKSDVDPDDLIKEDGESDAITDANEPAFSSSPSIVPGYVAKAANAGQISGVKESTSKITLTSTAFGTPTGLRYKIVDQPDHGTITPLTGTVDAGGWFASTQVRYTKNGSYNGPDSFKFAAKQAGSQFPLSPVSAAVTMQVGSGNGNTAVAISGAPSELYTSAGIQLNASVVPDGDATWKVDDIPGGNATVGTIDSKGFYKAPTTVPVDGKVRITATSEDGAFDAVEITIVARPVVTPKPDVPDPPLPPSTPKPPATPKTPTTPTTPALKPLSKPTIARVGRRLIVKYMPGKTGKLSVSVSRKGKRIASCKVGVVRARSATCRFTLKKSKVKKLTGKLTVYGKLTVKGKTVATRRTTVSLKVTARTTRFGPLCILTPLK
jgi:Lysyl oxidase